MDGFGLALACRDGRAVERERPAVQCAVRVTQCWGAVHVEGYMLAPTKLGICAVRTGANGRACTSLAALPERSGRAILQASAAISAPISGTVFVLRTKMYPRRTLTPQRRKVLCQISTSACQRHFGGQGACIYVLIASAFESIITLPSRRTTVC